MSAADVDRVKGNWQFIEANHAGCAGEVLRLVSEVHALRADVARLEGVVAEARAALQTIADEDGAISYLARQMRETALAFLARPDGQRAAKVIEASLELREADADESHTLKANLRKVAALVAWFDAVDAYEVRS